MKNKLTEINLKDTTREEIMFNLIIMKRYTIKNNKTIYYLMEDEFCNKPTFIYGDSLKAMFAIMNGIFLWNYEHGFMEIDFNDLVGKLMMIINKYY